MRCDFRIDQRRAPNPKQQRTMEGSWGGRCAGFSGSCGYQIGSINEGQVVLGKMFGSTDPADAKSTASITDKTFPYMEDEILRSNVLTKRALGYDEIGLGNHTLARPRVPQNK
jgi:hypothetical protein